MIAIAAGVSVDKTITRRVQDAHNTRTRGAQDAHKRRGAQDAHGGYKDREDDEDHDIVIAQKSASFRRWR